MLYIILGRVRFLEYVVLGYVKAGSRTLRWVTIKIIQWRQYDFYILTVLQTRVSRGNKMSYCKKKI